MGNCGPPTSAPRHALVVVLVNIEALRMAILLIFHEKLAFLDAAAAQAPCSSPPSALAWARRYVGAGALPRSGAGGPGIGQPNYTSPEEPLPGQAIRGCPSATNALF